MMFFLLGDSLVKTLLQTVSYPQLIWLRTLWSMLLLLLFVLASGKLDQLKATKPVQHFLRGLFLAIVSVGYYLSIGNFPLSAVATAFAGAPLIIAAISPLIMKEKASALQWFSTLIGFVGVCLVLKPDMSNISWHYLVLLTMPFCYATMMLWSKKLSETESDWALNFYSYIPLLLLSSYSAYQYWSPLSNYEHGLVVISGAASATGFVLLVAAFRIGKPVVIAPFEYFSIVMALTIDMVFWHFYPDYLGWLGVTLIITCAVLQGWQARKKTPLVTPHLRPEDTHTP